MWQPYVLPGGGPARKGMPETRYARMVRWEGMPYGILTETTCNGITKVSGMTEITSSVRMT